MSLDAPNFNLTHVNANGIRLQVATAGEGTPVLLLHGWPHTWFLWHKVMPTLARYHRVIAPDLRGIGGSTRAVEGYDLHTLSDDMADLLTTLNARRAVVVGIDAGAPVAWMLAMRHDSGEYVDVDTDSTPSRLQPRSDTPRPVIARVRYPYPRHIQSAGFVGQMLDSGSYAFHSFLSAFS